MSKCFLYPLIHVNTLLYTRKTSECICYCHVKRTEIRKSLFKGTIINVWLHASLLYRKKKLSNHSISVNLSQCLPPQRMAEVLGIKFGRNQILKNWLQLSHSSISNHSYSSIFIPLYHTKVMSVLEFHSLLLVISKINHLTFKPGDFSLTHCNSCMPDHFIW